MDVVVMWVDGSDPVWLKKKNDCLRQMGQQPGETAARWRDWGIMRYWFRSMEENMPWVDHIFFVVDHQVPAWLNLSAPKLRIVNHEDFMPKRYLPCFAATIIEMNLFRIKELSEEFLLFNDDFFMNRPAKPEDYFVNGLPRYTYSEDVCNQKNFTLYNYFLYNRMLLINKHFSKKKLVRKHWKKILSPKNGKDALKNLLHMPFDSFSWFRSIHGQPYPLLKSTMAEIWKKEPDYMENMCLKHFRTYDQVNIALVEAWDMARGHFSPVSMMGTYYTCKLENAPEWTNDILKKKSLSVCLNDPGDVYEMSNAQLDKLIHTVQDVLHTRYPTPCSYEI